MSTTTWSPTISMMRARDDAADVERLAALKGACHLVALAVHDGGHRHLFVADVEFAEEVAIYHERVKFPPESRPTPSRGACGSKRVRPRR